MAFTMLGPVKFMGGLDSEGHRTYQVTYKMETRAVTNVDGPQQAMVCPGLPVVGATYSFGNEIDVWAWRQPGIEVEPVGEYREGDFPRVWYATVTFSTKPRRADQERPHSPDVQDPLAEWQKVSGDFSSYTEEGLKDRHGNPTLTSSFERIRGPQNEWDCSRPCVMIEQNVADLQLNLLYRMKDTLNDAPLWGFPVRAIKFKPQGWSKQYGKEGTYYYTRRLLFEVNVRPDENTRVFTVTTTNGLPTLAATGLVFGQTDVGRGVSGTGIPVGATIIAVSASGVVTLSTNATASGTIQATVAAHTSGVVGNWDRDILDEGTKVVRGFWDDNDPPVYLVVGDETKPSDFIHYQDPHGNFTSVLLNGAGEPATSEDDAGKRHVEFYAESNFLLLGIPLSF